MIIQKLAQANLIHPPKFLPGATQMLTIMGSDAFAVSSGGSDLDLYGFCIPPKEMVFPHLAGEVIGFGRPSARFEQWSEHHIKNPDGKDVQYDITVFSIVKYFQLCMENNPNTIDSLFTPRRCVLHSTAIGEHVRDNRRKFLHKGAWHKFKGYAYSQMTKIRNRTNATAPKRAADIARFGYDLKFAYHLVRLLDEVEQILVEHDLDLERNGAQLKSIRRGEWSLEQVVQYFIDKERTLETIYATSTLPQGPDEAGLKDLLLTCLEMHYGTVSTALVRNLPVTALIDDLKALIARYQGG